MFAIAHFLPISKSSLPWHKRILPLLIQLFFFTEEAHEKSTELENGIEKQLQINVQQIAEYEK